MPIDDDDEEEEDGPQGIQHPPGWIGPREQSGQKVRPFSSRLCPPVEHSDNRGHLERATPKPPEAAWVSKARGWKGPGLLPSVNTWYTTMFLCHLDCPRFP